MREIFINKNNKNNTTIALAENGILLERYEDIDSKEYLEENIYMGIVRDILPGMQAAFVDIGTEKNTFIHLKDALPKIDITKNNIKIDKKISEVLKPGQKILVQVKRDATNIKGAKVSTHISLASRYIVLMPENEIITVSQKITDEKEKNRLIEIVKNNIPENYGVIIRTSSMNRGEEELKQDIETTIKKWKKIKEKASNINIKLPVLIEEGSSFIKKMVIDLVDKEIDKIIVNNEEDYDIVKNILIELCEERNVKIDLRRNEDILNTYDMYKQIEKSKQRKVYLNCGGFITIDKTEALTAIDVNSGKYTGKNDLEETIVKVNKESTIEIAKQLRLRDIGGVIIIDYIDMDKEENKKKIENLLKEQLKKDRSKTQVIGFSKLNLLEMTRKHVRSEE
jgi:ribonuclease G